MLRIGFASLLVLLCIGLGIAASENDTYAYAKDIGDAKGVEIIKVHFKNTFRGIDTNIATVDSVWQVSDKNPDLVIQNTSNKVIITSANPLNLKEGYQLDIKSIPIYQDEAYIELSKNNEIIDSAVIILSNVPNGIYSYTKDIGEAKDVEVVKVHFKDDFRGADTDIATVDHIWQVSDTDPDLVVRNTSEKVILTSAHPLELDGGYELAIRSIDVRGARMYIELSRHNRTIDSALVIPPNLPCENYSYTKDIGNAKGIELIKIRFRNSFRGPDIDIATADRVWQASESNPGLVIRNNSERVILTSATPLQLEEGYQLAIASIDVEGNKIYAKLNRLNETVDSAIIVVRNIPNANYTYTRDRDGQDIEIIKAHFLNAFRGADTDIATVDRVWQVSDTNPDLVIHNSSAKEDLTSASPLRLAEGYEIVIGSIDVKGTKAYIELHKNSTIVDSQIVIPPAATLYQRAIDLYNRNPPFDKYDAAIKAFIVFCKT